MKKIIRKLEKTVDGGLAATSTTSNYIYITLDFLTFQHALLCAREKSEREKVHMKYENGVLPMIFIIIILYRDGRK